MKEKSLFIFKIAIFIILLLILSTPVVKALPPSFSIREWDTKQWTTPIDNLQSSGYELFCVEHGVPDHQIGISGYTVGWSFIIEDVKHFDIDGILGGYRFKCPDLWDEYTAATYTAQSEHNLPKWLSYVLTKEDEPALANMTNAQKRAIQYAIWNSGMNGESGEEVLIFSEDDSYEYMPSIELKTVLEMIIEERLESLEDRIEKILNYAVKFTSNKNFKEVEYEFEKISSEDKCSHVKYCFELDDHINNIRNKVTTIESSFRDATDFLNEQLKELENMIEQVKDYREDAISTAHQDDKEITESNYNKQIDYYTAMIEYYEETKTLCVNGMSICEKIYNDATLMYNDFNTILGGNIGALTELKNNFNNFVQNIIDNIENYEINKVIDNLSELENKLKETKEEWITETERLIVKAKQEYADAREYAKKLHNEGQNFTNFYNNYILTEDGETTGYVDNVFDNTEKEEVEVIADYDAQQYTIGPFNVIYPDQSYSMTYNANAYEDDGSMYYTNGIKFFDWISDIYLEDKYGNKKENIEILTGNNGKTGLSGPKSNMPASDEDFWIRFDNKADNGKELDLKSVKVKVKFKYIRDCTGKRYEYEGKGIRLQWVLKAEGGDGDWLLWWEAEKRYDYESQELEAIAIVRSCITLENTSEEEQHYKDNIEPTRVYDTHEITLLELEEYTSLRMELGGYVFEDGLLGKESVYNGLQGDSTDVPLPGIEVSLYEYDVQNGKIGKLATLTSEDQEKEAVDENDPEKEIRANPTLTDENGYYEFKGIDPMKKYVVMYTYNGQTYMPTDYKIGTSGNGPQDDYVTNSQNQDDPYEWLNNSKATEADKDRESYNTNYASIGSSPINYRIRNKYESGNEIGTQNVLNSNAVYYIDEKGITKGYYNKSFSEYDLVGITLNSEGKYEYNPDIQLIDTYLTIQDGYVIDTKGDYQKEEDGETIDVNGTFSTYENGYTVEKEYTGQVGYKAGIITQKIRAYMEQNKIYPDQDAMMNIYEEIVDQIGGGEEERKETWRKLQFIEDTKMQSWTGNARKDNSSGNFVYEDDDIQSLIGKGGIDVYPIYDKFVISDTDYEFTHNSENSLVVGVDNSKDVCNQKNLINRISNGEDIISKYKAIYKGQYYINLGLVERAKADISIKKDVYKATLTINGKTEVYEYNSRNIRTDEEKAKLEEIEGTSGRNSAEYLEYLEQLENKYWDIQARILDYATYYHTDNNYNRELYESDYYYKKRTQAEDKLEVYVTYKITVRNQSQNILTQIDELVDYYDNTYTPVLDKSWVMYQDSTIENNQNKITGDKDQILVKDQEYYDIMVEDKFVDGSISNFAGNITEEDILTKYRPLTLGNNYNVEEGQYAEVTKFDDEFSSEGYKTLYINGLKDKKLIAGESAYVYLTFKVNGSGDTLQIGDANTIKISNENTMTIEQLATNIMNSKGEIIGQGKTSPGKQNIVEINGYSTFYEAGVTFPNGGLVEGETITRNGTQIRGNNVAGLFDNDSNPGNFDTEALNNTENERYEQNFEDDADRARGLRVFVESTNIYKRIISGTVWEDKRTEEVKDSNGNITEALVGDGIRDKEEATVGDIYVELVEVELDENGQYKFDEYGNIVTKKREDANGNSVDYTLIYTEGGNFIDAATKTSSEENTKGTYTFEGIVPGDYIVRFTYGGAYNNYYNGQDYKSTTYQVGIDQNINQRTDIAKQTDPGYGGYSEKGKYDDGKENYITESQYEIIRDGVANDEVIDDQNQENIGETKLPYAQNSSGTYGYDIFATDSNIKGNVSDAKDIWRERQTLNNALDTGTKYKTANDLNNRNSENVTLSEKEGTISTQMTAETGVIRVEFEYNRQNSTQNATITKGENDELVIGSRIDGSISNNSYAGTETGENLYSITIEEIQDSEEIEIVNPDNNDAQNNYNGIYHIQNVDLGLEERPKAGLELNKQVNNVKITLANQTVLFDSTQSVHNLIWQPKTPYNITEMKENADASESSLKADKSQLVYSDYTKYDDFRGQLNERIETLINSEKGLIQATMDEELMHGATIQITYDMTVTNIGEVDYKETVFYYTGDVADTKTIVKTSADQVIDYVSNNLQYRAESNDVKNWGWKTITAEEIKENDYVQEGDTNSVASKLSQFNTIIITEALNEKLVPRPITDQDKQLPQAGKLTTAQHTGTDEVCRDYIQLVLTQSITSQNKNDDLSYKNIAEIVQISNDVGRRMAYSVQGNQDPTNPDAITEPDTSKAEDVLILPPFGEQQIYVGLAIAIITLLGISIAIIKKTVLNKNKF